MLHQHAWTYGNEGADPHTYLLGTSAPSAGYRYSNFAPYMQCRSTARKRYGFICGVLSLTFLRRAWPSYLHQTWMAAFQVHPLSQIDDLVTSKASWMTYLELCSYCFCVCRTKMLWEVCIILCKVVFWDILCFLIGLMWCRIMVVGPGDHGLQADIIFVIEGTAINGAYLNDLKSNYVIPTLE